MSITLMKFSTSNIPIFNAAGLKLDEIVLPEAIRPARHRRGGFSENGTYYKGTGIIYTGHFSNSLQPGMLEINQSTIPYQKYQVLYPNLYNKFGIFTFPHQPIFNDFEGGCGPKEENILTLLPQFEFAAIEKDVEVIDIPLAAHKIYKYRFRKLSGSYLNTMELLEYILTENFNCAWDKNVWADVVCYGYVRDLADWFISSEACHKLGTVYAFLNSIHDADTYLYASIVGALTQCEYLETLFLPYISALIVKHFCPSLMEEYDLEQFSPYLYGRLLNLLYSGKACCHLECDNFGTGIREHYKKEITQKICLMEHTLLQYHFQ